MTSQPARSRRGSAWPIAASRLRSFSVSVGRLCWRLSTWSWWRRTMISMSFERPDRTARRANVVRKRYRMRFTRSGSVRILTVQQPRPSIGHPQVLTLHSCKA